MPVETLESSYIPPPEIAEIAIPEVFVEAFREEPSPLELRSTKVSERQWYLLPGTGFDVRGQINKLIRSLNSHLDGKNQAQVVSEFVEDTAEDMRHFVIEYPLQRLVFPIFLDLRQGGVRKLIAPRYSNQTYSDLISSQERRGSVKSSVLRIESLMIDAPEGTIAGFISPPGWTDLEDRQGGKIEFVDNQIYLYKKTKTGLEARTVRTDLTLEQSELLLEQLNFTRENPPNLHTPEERIMTVVESVFYLQGQTFETVVDLIKTTKGSELAYKDRSFEEIYYDLSLGDDLLDFNLDVQKYAEPIIEQFKLLARNKLVYISDQTLDELEMELGKAILRIHKAIKSRHSSDEMIRPIPYMTETDFKRELVQLQVIPGCNGGSCRRFIITASGGVRELVGNSKSISPDFYEYCPACDEEINCTVKVGQSCPKCNKVRM
ncbi:hypothetical protein HYS94_03380 [Candidatus Daviesbacteria bacterium]|nr:hypothetical protein [Candidatus Daviesbacteria bacterium]